MAVLIFLLPGLAEARHHYYRPPTPPPIVTPPVITPVASGNLCMNYGHQTSTYNLTSVASDLNILTQAKISCIRTSYMGWNNTQSEALAVFAQSKGFRVIIGGDWGTFTPSSESSYQSQVLTEAKWAQANSIPQMSLGNEQEYRLSGISQAQWASFITNLAVQVKQVYSGQVSYETSGDFANFWAGQSLGSLDLLGLNLYCGYSCNNHYLQENITAHGGHTYISETNADMSTGQYTDASHATELKGDILNLLSVPTYYFTFGVCNNADGVATYWGLYNCGVLAQPLAAGVVL